MYIRRRNAKQKHNTIFVGHHFMQSITNNVNKTCVLLQTSYFLRKHRIEFEQTTWEAYTIYTLLSSFLYLRLKKVLLLCAVFVFFQVVSWTSIQLWLLIAVVLECRRFWQNVDQWGMYQCLGTNITCYSKWIFVNDIFNFLWTWWQIWLSVFCIIHF